MRLTEHQLWVKIHVRRIRYHWVPRFVHAALDWLLRAINRRPQATLPLPPQEPIEDIIRENRELRRGVRFEIPATSEKVSSARRSRWNCQGACPECGSCTRNNGADDDGRHCTQCDWEGP